MRESWTDERLDDFTRNVDQRFDRLEARVDDGFLRLREEIREMRTEMSAMQRSMAQFAGVFVAALVGLVATQLGLILIQV